MEEPDKRLFDALAEIKRATFTRIHERRQGEWKLTLSIWGGLAGLAAIILEKSGGENGAILLLGLKKVTGYFTSLTLATDRLIPPPESWVRFQRSNLLL